MRSECACGLPWAHPLDHLLHSSASACAHHLSTRAIAAAGPPTQRRSLGVQSIYGSEPHQPHGALGKPVGIEVTLFGQAEEDVRQLETGRADGLRFAADAG